MKRITMAAAMVVAVFLLTVGAPKASADKLAPPTSQVISPTMALMSSSVPDGGSTLMLLGGALAGLEMLRRKLRA